jgi:hypothetical protein
MTIFFALKFIFLYFDNVFLLAFDNNHNTIPTLPFFCLNDNYVVRHNLAV